MSDRKKSRPRKDGPAAAPLPSSVGKCRILAVGINSYSRKSGFPFLKKCDNGAFQVAATFREIPQLNADLSHLVLMTSETTAQLPSRGGILEQLQELTEGTSAQDRLLFYFSGHSQVLPKENDYFLVPQDAYSSSKPGALVSLREVLEILRGSPARQKLVILDCCWSGPAPAEDPSSFVTSPETVLREILAEIRGIAAIVAGAPDTAAFERSTHPKLSLFTFHLIQGLRGDPAAQENRLLTLSKLFAHLFKALNKNSSPDSPQPVTVLSFLNGMAETLADFGKLLTAASPPATGDQPFIALAFRESYPEKTKAILTEWKNRSFSPEQLEYAANGAEAMKSYLSETFGELRPVFRKKLGFTVSEVATEGASLSFPGGFLVYRFEALNKDAGQIHRELTLDIDWFESGCRLLSLLAILKFKPRAFELVLKKNLVPLDQLAGLESQGWNIEKETQDMVLARKSRVSMTITANTLSFEGFDLELLFNSAASPEQDLLTETISIIS